MTYALSYDGDGQLLAITTGSGMSLATVASYTYDAGQRRTNRTVGGTTTNFVYGRASVINEVQSGSVTATYTYGNTLIGKGTDVNLYDGQGSNCQTTSNSGTLTASATYEGFGQTVALSGSASTYGYAATSSYQSDGDAGLTHVGGRYYDASVGRFITRDTQSYTYCEGDPVNLVDPDGHSPSPGHVILIGFLIVGIIATAVMAAPALAVIFVGAGIATLTVAVVAATVAQVAAIGVMTLGIYFNMNYAMGVNPDISPEDE